MTDLYKQIHEAFLNDPQPPTLAMRNSTVAKPAAAEWQNKKRWIADAHTNWREVLETRNQWISATIGAGKVEFHFLLPFAMAAEMEESYRDIEGRKKEEDTIGYRIFYRLLMMPSGLKFDTVEYLQHLRRISPRKAARYFKLTPAQVKAVAAFLKQWAQRHSFYIYIKNRKMKLESLHYHHVQSVATRGVNDYTLTYEGAIAIFDEECRILADWVALSE